MKIITNKEYDRLKSVEKKYNKCRRDLAYLDLYFDAYISNDVREDIKDDVRDIMKEIINEYALKES